jgi:hypothetical protein
MRRERGLRAAARTAVTLLVTVFAISAFPFGGIFGAADRQSAVDEIGIRAPHLHALHKRHRLHRVAQIVDGAHEAVDARAVRVHTSGEECLRVARPDDPDAEAGRDAAQERAEDDPGAADLRDAIGRFHETVDDRRVVDGVINDRVARFVVIPATTVAAFQSFVLRAPARRHWSVSTTPHGVV